MAATARDRALTTGGFDALVGAVERRWAVDGHELAKLPSLAAAALGDYPRADIDVLAIAERGARSSKLLPQFPNSFGDAEVTIARGEQLIAHLLYWLDNTTAIHQHPFCGAFAVLTGTRLHTTYTFAAERADGTALRIGKLMTRQQEVLRAGDIREIGPGDALIHNLIHLDHPSATLTLQTRSRPELMPHWVYYAPGVALNPLHDDAQLAARLRLFDVCRRIDARRGARAAAAIVADGLHASWLVLGKVGESAPAPAVLAPFYRMVRDHHGDDGDVLVDAFERLRMRLRLARLRLKLRTRAHRTFLAMLSDGGDRATILATIARVFPRRSAGALLEAWIVDLAEVFGLKLERDDARVLRRLAEGVAAKAIAREVRGYTTGVVEQLARAVRESLLAPLVSP